MRFFVAVMTLIAGVLSACGDDNDSDFSGAYYPIHPRFIYNCGYDIHSFTGKSHQNARIVDAAASADNSTIYLLIDSYNEGLLISKIHRDPATGTLIFEKDLMLTIGNDTNHNFSKLMVSRDCRYCYVMSYLKGISLVSNDLSKETHLLHGDILDCSISRDGSFLYTDNYIKGGHQYSLHEIDPASGLLSPPSTFTLDESAEYQFLFGNYQFTIDGERVYHHDSRRVLCFTRNQHGDVVSHEPVIEPAMTIDTYSVYPDGTHIFICSGALGSNDTFSWYRKNADGGGFTLGGEVSVNVQEYGCAILPIPDSNDVYYVLQGGIHHMVFSE